MASRGANFSTDNLQPASNVPRFGTFYRMQRLNYPPLPYNRFPELPVYQVTERIYLVDDRSVDYEQLAAESRAAAALAAMLSGYDGPLEGGNPPLLGPQWGPGDLWLEIVAGDARATNLLHGTITGESYELFSKDSLDDPYWLPVEIRIAPDDPTIFTDVSKFTPVNRFFRAQHGGVVITMYKHGDASEPGSLGGTVSNYFAIYAEFRGSATNSVTVHCRLSGTASNGVDYTTLPATVEVPYTGGSLGYAEVWVEPLQDSLVEFDETVTLTIDPDPAYLIDPDHPSETMVIVDNLFQVVTELDHPVGLDYHPMLKALIASVSFNTGGEPYNFVRIYTNGTSTNLFVTNWSGIHGLTDEVKVAIAQTNYGGFQAGEMFFGTGVNGVIGRLSPDGTSSNLNWAVLTDNTNSTDTLLRGGLYLDQTGVFGGDLVAVTGNLANEGGGVWQVNSDQQATHIVSLTNNDYPHLEGVVTLPSNTPAWGPWAGKLITGAEAAQPQPLVHAVGPDGTYHSYELGIAPEDFDVIPASQDLYCIINQDPGTSRLVKIPQQAFEPYVGKMLITQAGESVQDSRIFIVRWDADRSSFVVMQSISWPHEAGGHFEHVSFAPINLPSY